MLQMTCVPLGFQYTIIEFPLGSLYYTTLLSNLNSREYVRGRQTDWSEYMSSSSGNGMAETGNNSTSGGGSFVLSTFRTRPNYEFQNSKGSAQSRMEGEVF